MNKQQIHKYEEALNAKKAELKVALGNREGIVILKSPDSIDEVRSAEDRDMEILKLDRSSKALDVVEGALGRIADGSYGICLCCKEPIKPKRLDAVPEAKYCVGCQDHITALVADGHEEEEALSIVIADAA